jgi:histidinol-phosphate aminotransferase
VPPTEPNFVWLPAGEDTAGFAEACDQAGIGVRPFAPDGVRVTIADRPANDAFLEVAAEFPARH